MFVLVFATSRLLLFGTLYTLGCHRVVYDNEFLWWLVSSGATFLGTLAEMDFFAGNNLTNFLGHAQSLSAWCVMKRLVVLG